MDIDRYFQQQLNDFFRESPWSSWSLVPTRQPTQQQASGSARIAQPQFSPPCHLDMKETPTSFLIKAELPGVPKELIHVSASNQLLTISAEKKCEMKEERGDAVFEERRFGRIERTIRLPQTCDADKCQARYENGVLSLEFEKKKEEESGRRIAID
jgi:HSP20 family protein